MIIYINQLIRTFLDENIETYYKQNENIININNPS